MKAYAGFSLEWYSFLAATLTSAELVGSFVARGTWWGVVGIGVMMIAGVAGLSSAALGMVDKAKEEARLAREEALRARLEARWASDVAARLAEEKEGLRRDLLELSCARVVDRAQAEARL